MEIAIPVRKMRADEMNDITLQISMHAQKQYEEAVEKYGEDFAEAVVASELQLYADNLDCFDEYAQMDAFQEFIVGDDGE